MRIPPQAPSLNDLLPSHGDKLAAALGDPRYASFVRECEVAYRPWRKVKIIARGLGLNPEVAWLLVKFNREQRYTTLPLRGAATDIRFLLPDHASRDLMLIDQHLAGLLGPDSGALSKARGDQLIRTALREEAIASSMIEGAATTRVEAKRMLRLGRKPRTPGERMVVNNYEAIQYLRERRHERLTPEMLLEVQAILTSETTDDPNEVGRFRTDDDRVEVFDRRENEVIHTPPPASELPARLEMLCRFANDDSQAPFIHPVVRACLLHFQIGFDHPFCDGNGRTARAIFLWSMLHHGYWLFEYLPFSRQIYQSVAKYTRAYLDTETDGFDATYFILYNLRVIGLIREDFAKYLAKKHERVLTVERVTREAPGLNHRQRDIIVRLAREPDLSITIAEHADKHAVVYQTARTDILGLVEKGYLTQRKIGKRYEFFPDSKLLDRLGDLDDRTGIGD